MSKERKVCSEKTKTTAEEADGRDAGGTGDRVRRSRKGVLPTDFNSDADTYSASVDEHKPPFKQKMSR